MLDPNSDATRCNSGQCSEQKTRCLCGICKRLQRPIYLDIRHRMERALCFEVCGRCPPLFHLRYPCRLMLDRVGRMNTVRTSSRDAIVDTQHSNLRSVVLHLLPVALIVALYLLALEPP
jgi:hypothetical protein